MSTRILFSVVNVPQLQHPPYSPNAVSYTHLDVYKRQVVNCVLQVVNIVCIHSREISGAEGNFHEEKVIQFINHYFTSTNIRGELNINRNTEKYILHTATIEYVTRFRRGETNR